MARRHWLPTPASAWVGLVKGLGVGTRLSSGPGFCGAVCALAITADTKTNAPATAARNIFTLPRIRPLFHRVLREGATRLNDGIRSLGRVDVAVGIDRHALTRRALVHAILPIEGWDERHDAILVHRSDAHAVVPVRMVQRTRL